MKRCEVCGSGGYQYVAPPDFSHQKTRTAPWTTLKFKAFQGADIEPSLCGLHVVIEARRIFGSWWKRGGIPIALEAADNERDGSQPAEGITGSSGNNGAVADHEHR
jgi:hypothetical protein